MKKGQHKTSLHFDFEDDLMEILDGRDKEPISDKISFRKRYHPAAWPGNAISGL